MILKKLLPIIVILILGSFTIRPLLHPGFFAFHDDQQVARLFEMNKTLLGGIFPVRWVDDLGFGYGYPLFNFYPPLVYYLGEIFHLIGFGFIDSVKIVWAIALLGSGIAMYFLSKEFFGKAGGIISALFYIYVPYHAVDAYVRGALSELFSFVWLPLILRFSSKPIISGIFLALLMLTHNLIFLPFVGIFIVWSFLIKKSFLNLLFSLLICFGVTAFFWLPALWEKQFTLVDQFLTTNLASYKIHFVCLPQLWNSLWGYGGSVVGCVDGMSFKLGKLHILVIFLALGIAIFKKSKIIFTSLFFFIFSVFMTTEYSAFIWDKISPLWYLQFPWRFLEFAALFSSFLAGSIFVTKNKFLKIFLFIFLISLLVYGNAKLFQPREYLFVTDRELTSDKEIKWRVSQTSFEFMPKGFALNPIPSEQNFSTVGGRFQFSAYFSAESKIQFPVVNFPGWKIWVDNSLIPIDDNNDLKLITILVPEGSHQILGKFTDTPVRQIGNLVSLFAIIGVGAIYFYGRKRN